MRRRLFKPVLTTILKISNYNLNLFISILRQVFLPLFLPLKDNRLLIGGYAFVLIYLIIGIISLGMIIFLDKKIIKIEKHRAFLRVTHLVFITYKMINFLVTFERFSLPLGEI